MRTRCKVHLWCNNWESERVRAPERLSTNQIEASNDNCGMWRVATYAIKVCCCCFCCCRPLLQLLHLLLLLLLLLLPAAAAGRCCCRPLLLQLLLLLFVLNYIQQLCAWAAALTSGMRCQVGRRAQRVACFAWTVLSARAALLVFNLAGNAF